MVSLLATNNPNVFIWSVFIIVLINVIGIFFVNRNRFLLEFFTQYCNNKNDIKFNLLTSISQGQY